MVMSKVASVLVLSLLASGACTPSESPADAGASDAAADAPTPVDVVAIDAVAIDAVAPKDAPTPVDAPTPADALTPVDAPTPTVISMSYPCRTMAVHAGALYCGVGGIIVRFDTASLAETRPYSAPPLTIESLAVDDGGLVWTERAPAMMSTNGAVRTCPLAGCGAAPTLLAMQQEPFDLAIDATHAFFLRSNVLYAVERGASRTLRTLPRITATPGNNGDVATDGTTLYWLDPNVAPAAGQVMACAPASCTPRVVVGEVVGGRSLTVANGRVYVTGDDETFSVRTDGTGRERLGAGGVDVVADARDVFWVGGPSRGTEGQVYRCAVAGCGGSPTVLASGQSSPWTLAADATHVYWSNLTSGGSTPMGLYRVARSP